MSAQLFISYRRSRSAEVVAAKALLEQAGLRVWLDLADIPALAEFDQRIRDGIDASHAMLVWWSGDYADSDICLQELRRAWQHARRRSSDVARRVWILNPESGGEHIFAGELNRSNFLAPPPAGAGAQWAAALGARLDELLPEGPLADERQAEPMPALYGAPDPSAAFTGRGAELMRIHSALFPAQVGAAARRVAVQTHGMGGIGKTELAANYVDGFAHAFPAGVLWLNLATWQPPREATLADAQGAWLRALDQALGQHPSLLARLTLDPEGKAVPAPVVRERLAELLGEVRPSLVVLDNLPELTPLDLRRRILDFLAAPGREGRTLVTTRDARGIDRYGEIRLDVLGPEDALRLLARVFPAEDRESRLAAQQPAMEALVREVGGHTLALVLLGERYGKTAQGYPAALEALQAQGPLQRIEAIARDLRDELGERARGIVATFAISIEPLSAEAKRLLALASVCAPGAPIPEALLEGAFGGSDEDVFARALRELARASLIHRRSEDGHWQMHALAGQAALALLAEDPEALDGALAQALLERLAVLQDDRSQARALASEAIQAYHMAERCRDRNGVRLWLRLGQYEEGRGQLGPARAAEEAAVDLAKGVLGEEHPDTLTSMNNLASALKSQGDLGGARKLQEAVLEARRRLLGPEHPDTLTSMNNLASTLWNQGDLGGARKLQEAVLEARRRLLGPEHPDTLSSMNNLAGTLWNQGDLGGARKLQAAVLEARRRLLGPEHPNTSISAWNLFMTLHQSGDAEAAARVLRGDLSWLAERDPAQLGAQQREIRGFVRQVSGLDGRGSPSAAQRSGKAGRSHAGARLVQGAARGLRRLAGGVLRALGKKGSGQR